MRYFVNLFLYLMSLFHPNVYGQNLDVCENTKCIAVVDAGSTGSRLHVYAYHTDVNHQLTKLSEIYQNKINMALGKTFPGQATVNHYLNQLFKDEPTSTIPVFFYATAGMRLFPHDKQESYYSYLKKWFNTQPTWHLKEAKTLSGKEEGILGWLAVNYAYDNFGRSNQKYAGVMDMGGASVQITFPVKKTQSINTYDLAKVKVGKQTIYLFSHSFLGLGESLVRSQFLDNPNCFAQSYELPDNRMGTGDIYKCEDDLSILINQLHHVNSTLASKLPFALNNTWYAIGGVSSMLSNEPFRFDDFNFTIRQLRDDANQAICRQDWHTLSSQYPNDNTLETYCLKSAYYSALIHKGYGIAENQPIQFPEGSHDLSWTVGVVLQQL